ncbi:MAG: hypothetical protein P4L51_02855 [Puia sp.]|nr:hypothetical protein [Puia sp.]
MRCHLFCITPNLLARVFPVCLLSFIAPSFSYGQTKEKTKEQTRQEILDNDQLSARLINADPDLKTVKLESEYFLQLGYNGRSRMIAYCKGDTICRISLWFDLFYGVSRYEYYLKNFRTFFIYEAEEGFPKKDSVGAPDRTMLAMNFEGKYYFDDREQLVDKKIRGRKMLDDDEINTWKDQNPAEKDDGSNPDIRSLLANAVSYVRIIQAHLKKMQTQ